MELNTNTGQELLEEAAVRVKEGSIQPLLYSEAYIDEPLGEWKFIGMQLRYMCRISEKLPFMNDVGGDIVYQMYCDIDEIGLLHRILGHTILFLL